MVPNPHPHDKDGRGEVRKLLRCHARLLQKGLPPLVVTTVDICAQGMSLMAPENVHPGNLCGVDFETLVKGKPVHVQAVAKVMYSICVGTTGFRVGLLFTEVDANSKAAINQLIA